MVKLGFTLLKSEDSSVRPPNSWELDTPLFAQQYAEQILRARWPEKEALIASQAPSAFYYAEQVIKGRWPEGEPEIATDADFASRYAALTKKRFKLGEPAIMGDPRELDYYRDVLAVNDPEGLAEFELEHGDWAPDTVAEAALDKARSLCQ